MDDRLWIGFNEPQLVPQYEQSDTVLEHGSAAVVVNCFQTVDSPGALAEAALFDNTGIVKNI